jgi:ketosteroid isomerase-like protein
MDSRAIALIADESAIRKTIYRGARGLDRRDFDLVRSCYHEDASVEYGRFRGPIGEFVETLPEAFRSYGSLMHFIGNVLIEIDGDEAVSEAYCLAFHCAHPGSDGGEEERVARLRYVDRFERRDGEWRIAHRRAIYDPGRVDAVGRRYEPGNLAFLGRPGPDDPLPPAPVHAHRGGH